jgi:hypothetical protein
MRNKRIVYTRERHKVCLKIVQVHVESTIETQTGGNGANDLGNKAVEMAVPRTRDIQVALTYIVDSLVIDEESAFRVLNGTVC